MCFSFNELGDWWGRFRYALVGRRVRTKACTLAALVLSTRKDAESLVPLGWSLTVFFETYIWSGAEGTREAFGPKDPVELRPQIATVKKPD
jgi:hypothetical protein